MSKYKVGDVVKLNSGGPNVTVHAVGPKSSNDGFVWLKEGEVQVQWFDEKQMKDAIFTENELHPV